MRETQISLGLFPGHCMAVERSCQATRQFVREKCTLSEFALLWLLVAAGCVLGGAYLTARSADGEPYKRTPERPRQCRYCGEKLDTDARFCGGCGKWVDDGQTRAGAALHKRTSVAGQVPVNAHTPSAKRRPDRGPA
jgi:hypothetical protein